MEITMPDYVLADLINVAVRSAVQAANESKAHISKSAAYRKYGRLMVDKWERDGKIKKDGGKWKLSPAELETLYQIEKRPFYSLIKQKK